MLASSLFALATLPLGIVSAYATPFSFADAQTAAQTLGGASGETGSVTRTGALTVSGSNPVVTITGHDATVDNQGSMSQTGSGRVVRDNTGTTGLTIVNGSLGNSSASMQAAKDDVLKVGKPGGSITVHNYGQMTATGGQVMDLTDMTSGANVVNNHAGGVMTSYEADAVRPGVNGVVNNAGTIRSVTAKGDSSDGIDAQNNSGVQVDNAATGLVDGGRHGITGGQANADALFTIGVTNAAGGVIRGNNGAGLNIDGTNAKQTATIVNRGTITGNGVTGDGDGIDIDGLANITNSGTIRSLNAMPGTGETRAFSEGISVGGGTVTNSGTIEGLVAPGNASAVGRGITLTGNDKSDGTREGLYGNAVVTNQAGGLVRGDSDSAILATGAASGYTVTIHNNAGATLLGGGTANAAVKTGLDNDTIRNAGTINGASSGMAIDMGGGNNQLYIAGGQAVVLGSINGGVGGSNTMTMAPGAGNSFAYAGGIANFARVAVESGTVRLSGVSSYTGVTELSGGTLVLDGADRLAAASRLALAGGTLSVDNADGQLAQSFAGLSLLEDSFLDLNGAALSFDTLDAVALGKTLLVLGFFDEGPLDYAFRFLGDWSQDANFLALIGGTLIDGARAIFWFDGQYTGVARAASEVPEPATHAIVLLGLVAAAAAARRRRQR
ncbi:beta strand repeat-containing protein [Pseudorhodoferax sp.]|uniref:beta strand repeat-containing protein n=1 Tax=Pseudorhodoferax sp. TaxID=1993553 RepID=UPI002DD62A6F|nr:PEP-CTERM sorting domain-containing protein [Pseudorhodoferax sp.]